MPLPHLRLKGMKGQILNRVGAIFLGIAVCQGLPLFCPVLEQVGKVPHVGGKYHRERQDCNVEHQGEDDGYPISEV